MICSFIVIHWLTVDIYRIVSDIDDTIPLGAPISIDFGFNGEGITLPPSSSTDLTFYPLFHVPAIEPTSIFYDVELRRIIVSYNHVSPSLSGEYVLCQEAGPPPSRKRRGVDPEPMRPNVCGGRITITVTSKCNAEQVLMLCLYWDFNDSHLIMGIYLLHG